MTFNYSFSVFLNSASTKVLPSEVVEISLHCSIGRDKLKPSNPRDDQHNTGPTTLPWSLAGFDRRTKPAPWAWAAGVAALAAVVDIPLVEVTDVRAGVTVTVAVDQSHDFIDGRFTGRGLSQALIQKSVESIVLVAIDVTAKGPLMKAEDTGGFLLGEPTFGPVAEGFFITHCPDLLL